MTVNFTPNKLETFQGHLEVTIEMPEGLIMEKFEINLRGVGVVPEIRFVEPDIYSGEGLTFPLTLIGYAHRRNLKIENMGFTSCRVIIEVEGDIDRTLQLKCSDVNSSTYTENVQNDDGECLY